MRVKLYDQTYDLEVFSTHVEREATQAHFPINRAAGEIFRSVVTELRENVDAYPDTAIAVLSVDSWGEVDVKIHDSDEAMQSAAQSGKSLFDAAMLKAGAEVSSIWNDTPPATVEAAQYRLVGYMADKMDKATTLALYKGTQPATPQEQPDPSAKLAEKFMATPIRAEWVMAGADANQARNAIHAALRAQKVQPLPNLCDQLRPPRTMKLMAAIQPFAADLEAEYPAVFSDQPPQAIWASQESVAHQETMATETREQWEARQRAKCQHGDKTREQQQAMDTLQDMLGDRLKRVATGMSVARAGEAVEGQSAAKFSDTAGMRVGKDV